MVKRNTIYIGIDMLNRLFFLLFLLVTIPFVTNTFSFLANDVMVISFIIETDLESESSELNDVDDDFFHMISNVCFDSENGLLSIDYIKQSTFYLYFDNPTPPPDKFFI